MTRTEGLVAPLAGGAVAIVCGVLTFGGIATERLAVESSETTQVCGLGCGGQSIVGVFGLVMLGVIAFAVVGMLQMQRSA